MRFLHIKFRISCSGHARTSCCCNLKTQASARWSDCQTDTFTSNTPELIYCFADNPSYLEMRRQTAGVAKSTMPGMSFAIIIGISVFAIMPPSTKLPILYIMCFKPFILTESAEIKYLFFMHRIYRITECLRLEFPPRHHN